MAALTPEIDQGDCGSNQPCHPDAASQGDGIEVSP
jgi:hypothetical protein